MCRAMDLPVLVDFCLAAAAVIRALPSKPLSHGTQLGTKSAVPPPTEQFSGQASASALPTTFWPAAAAVVDDASPVRPII